MYFWRKQREYPITKPLFSQIQYPYERGNTCGDKEYHLEREMSQTCGIMQDIMNLKEKFDCLQLTEYQRTFFGWKPLYLPIKLLLNRYFSVWTSEVLPRQISRILKINTAVNFSFYEKIDIRKTIAKVNCDIKFALIKNEKRCKIHKKFFVSHDCVHNLYGLVKIQNTYFTEAGHFTNIANKISFIMKIFHSLFLDL